jgi:hypothetical protein
MPTGTPYRGGGDATRRRSQRVILTLGITVRTVDAPNVIPFEEDTHTLVVNVHGALIVLSSQVAKDQKLRLMNRATKEEQICRVANLGTSSGGKTQIGIEFLNPSPEFWRISFPPEDWVLPEPTTATADKT